MTNSSRSESKNRLVGSRVALCGSTWLAILARSRKGPGAWIHDHSRQFRGKRTQGGGTGRDQGSWPQDIGIQIGHSVTREVVQMGPDPFGRADDALLLGIPGRVHDRALGLPSLPHQQTQDSGLLEHGGVSGVGILGTEHPSVVMIAPNHPLVGPNDTLK